MEYQSYTAVHHHIDQHVVCQSYSVNSRYIGEVRDQENETLAKFFNQQKVLDTENGVKNSLVFYRINWITHFFMRNSFV